MLPSISQACVSWGPVSTFNPDDYRGYTNRGIVKLEKNDNKGALVDLKKASELGDEKAEELINEYCS